MSVEGFEEQINEIHSFHEEQLVEILAGNLIPKLEFDPLTGEKYDYSQESLQELADNELYIKKIESSS